MTKETSVTADTRAKAQSFEKAEANGDGQHRCNSAMRQSEMFPDSKHVPVHMHLDVQLLDINDQPISFCVGLGEFFDYAKLLELHLKSLPQPDKEQSVLHAGPKGTDVSSTALIRRGNAEQEAERLHRALEEESQAREDAIGIDATQLAERTSKELNDLEKQLKHQRNLSRSTNGQQVNRTIRIGNLPPSTDVFDETKLDAISEALRSTREAKASLADTRILTVTQVEINGCFFARCDDDPTPEKYRAQEGHNLRPGDRVRARVLRRVSREVEHYQRVIEFERLDE